jgi:hypothetical protein
MPSRTPANGHRGAKGMFRLSLPLGAAIALSGLLAGCATTPPVRYVPTYCVTKAQLETLQKAEPGKVGSQLTGNAQNDLKTIAGNDIALRAYSDGLLTVIGGCVQK